MGGPAPLNQVSNAGAGDVALGLFDLLDGTIVELANTLSANAKPRSDLMKGSALVKSSMEYATLSLR
jgi:hypothetical protein